MDVEQQYREDRYLSVKRNALIAQEVSAWYANLAREAVRHGENAYACEMQRFAAQTALQAHHCLAMLAFFDAE